MNRKARQACKTREKTFHTRRSCTFQRKNQGLFYRFPSCPYKHRERTVLAYVTSAVRGGGSQRLFFSTVSLEQLQIFCVWQEKAHLNQTGSEWMQYILLFLYSFRWPIEVSYYMQKTFWSLSSYMVQSQKGIEMLVNLIILAYCAIKLLPYQDKDFSKYRNESVQEFRFILSSRIRKQVFFATFVQNIETTIKSNAIIEALMSLLQRQ